jgi:uncharacterized membrane protein YqhA
MSTSPSPSRRPAVLRRLEQAFEFLLWNSRLAFLVAVIASVALALVLLWMATVDVVGLGGDVVDYTFGGGGHEAHAELRPRIIAGVVEAVDGYLLAAIMFIFALGLYELFVSRIEAAEGSEFAERLLLIRSLDDLKDRLAKVVILILVVKFFEYALDLEDVVALDLVWLALGVALLAAALYLTHGKGARHS